MRLNKELILNNEKYSKLYDADCMFRGIVSSLVNEDYDEEDILGLFYGICKYAQALNESVKISDYYSNKNHEIIEKHMKWLKEHGVDLNNQNYKPLYFDTNNNVCDKCSNNIKNGGSGICNCLYGSPQITC